MKRKSEPRHWVKMGISQAEAKKEAVRMYKEGMGPLSIAVRLNVKARLVMTALCRAGLIEEYEPQCYSLNGQYL